MTITTFYYSMKLEIPLRVLKALFYSSIFAQQSIISILLLLLFSSKERRTAIDHMEKRKELKIQRKNDN